MKSQFSVTIDNPCNEDWNKMPQNERGRFCSSCQETVIDFTTKSDTEIIDFFKNNDGNTCGWFYNNQLNRPLINRSYSKFNKFYRLIIGIVMMFYIKNVKANSVVTNSKLYSSLIIEESEGDTLTFTGVVKDNNENNVPYVVLYVEFTSISTKSDSNGNFELKIPTSLITNKNFLIVNSTGYERRAINIADLNFNTTICLTKNSVRDVSELAGATGQVIQEDMGAEITMCGGRGEGHTIFIDGVKMTGSKEEPRKKKSIFSFFKNLFRKKH